VRAFWHKGRVFRLFRRIRERVPNADAVTLLIAAATSYRSYSDVSGDPAALVASTLERASRKSIDALSQLVSLGMGKDPLSGQVFVFIGRRRDKAKLLVWDRHGFWVLYKRLEAGRFTDPARLGHDGIAMSELIAWLEGIDLSRVRRLQAVSASVVS